VNLNKHTLPKEKQDSKNNWHAFLMLIFFNFEQKMDPLDANTSTSSLENAYAGELATMDELEQQLYKNRLRRRKQHETSDKIDFGMLNL
jgi:hypothetical protein